MQSDMERDEFELAEYEIPVMSRVIMRKVITEQVSYLSYAMQINVHMATHILSPC